jgi:hypothetical protein
LKQEIKDGKWHTIVQRIVLNDLNSYNGVAETWIDGKLAASQGNYRFMSGSKTLFWLNRIYFSTFFGGGGTVCTDAQVSAGTRLCSRYADGTNYYWYVPRKNETIYFDDVVVYYYNSQAAITKGNVKSDPSRMEYPPIIGNPVNPACRS